MNCGNETCNWNLAPSLADAVLGYIKCSNCEHKNSLADEARLEIAQDFEQKVHVLEHQVYDNT